MLASLRLQSPLSDRQLFYDVASAAYVTRDGSEHYAVKDGVVSMLDRNDPFYEGAYLNRVAYVPAHDRLPYVLPLWLINSGYVWRVAHEIAPTGIVLELGGAGGVAYFGRRYTMIGIDLSASSLRHAAKDYALGIQANAAERIPLADSSVDGIVSSYFWEHIAPSAKPALLAECVRVLKPGGKLVFLYDVTTENPIIAWFRKRDPARYEAEFLAIDGHVGYQTPTENAAIFEAVGLCLRQHFGMERTFVLGPSMFQKLASWPSHAQGLLRRLSRLGQSPWFYGYTAITRVTDETAGRLCPIDWSRIMLTVAEKPQPVRG